MFGFGGRLKGFIPPRASGMSGAIIIGFVDLSTYVVDGLSMRDGILLILLGLFYASNL